VGDFQGDMTLAVLKAVAARFPTQNVIFHGGEPTMFGASPIREAISVLGNRDYSIQSNLMNVPKGIGSIVREYCGGIVGTSFDYSRIPYLPSWISNVYSLITKGIKVYVVITVTDDFSATSLEYYISVLAQAGISGFQLQFVTPINTAPISMDKYREIYNALISHPLNRTAKKMLLALNSGCGQLAVNGGNCARNGVRTIEPNGDVYVCPDFAGQKIFKLGNVLDESFDDGPGNPNNAIFYERERNLVLSCDEDCWTVCQGGCVSFTYFNQKNCASERDPFCRMYKRIIADAA